MTRKQAIVLMTIAGRENDQHVRVRLLVEARVNREALNAAWAKGVNLQLQLQHTEGTKS